MIVTNEFLEQHKASRSGFTKAQLAVFGIEWPPFTGWKFEIIGKDWPDETVRRFIEAKHVYCKSTQKSYAKKARRGKRWTARPNGIGGPAGKPVG